MNVIFVRHAKAELRQPGLADLDRHIIKKGKERLSKLIVTLDQYVKTDEKERLVTWSSPATRAQETAKMVIDQLALPEAEFHEFIYSGDFEAFTQALAQYDDTTTIMLFGHEPTLSHWVERMTGTYIELKTSAMVAVKISQKDPWQGEVLWEIHP